MGATFLSQQVYVKGWGTEGGREARGWEFGEGVRTGLNG